MKDVNDFIDTLVTINYIESANAYGHYPFQLYVETKEKTVELNALLLGGNVSACYLRAKAYLIKGVKALYMSIDFPAGGDIDNDFVTVFYIDADNKISALAIPYDTKTGEKFEIIYKCEMLTNILVEFRSVLVHI